MFEHIEQISNNLIQIKWALVSVAALFWIRAIIEIYHYLKERSRWGRAEKVIGFNGNKK